MEDMDCDVCKSLIKAREGRWVIDDHLVACCFVCYMKHKKECIRCINNASRIPNRE